MSLNKPQRVTISEVAREASVSIATVSRALNHTGNVAPETVAAVLSAADELGYRPNRAARMLAAQRTYAIGVLVDEITGDYMLPMIRGIELTTRDAGYEFMINSTRRRMLRGGYPVNETNTDGLLVFANSAPASELQRLSQLGFPVVLLHGSPPPGLPIPYVTVANKAGAYEMASYLIETRGYRRFAFLRGPDEHEDTLWRERGYREALAAHGLDYAAQISGNGGFNEDISYETVTQWLRRGLSMEVIVAFDDASAVGVIAALKNAGIRVPEEIAVTGFDDIRLAQYLDPALTTARVPIEQAARIAVQKLIRLIETGEVQQPILLPTELIIRRSCGCC